MSFASRLRYCTDVAQRESTKLCTMFGRLLGWYTIHTLLGLLPHHGILPGAKFTLCPSMHHRTTFSGCIFATKASIDNRKINLLNSNISPTWSCNIANFGLLAAEIVSLVWGTPGNFFNGFRVLATLLQRRRSTEVNQTLHYVWPSPGLVRYIYTFGISCP